MGIPRAGYVSNVAGKTLPASKCRVCTAIASTVAGTRTQPPLLRTPEPQGRVGYRHY